MAMKKCPNCGKRIAPKAQFCIYCAVRFDKNKSVKTVDDIDASEVLAEEDTVIEEIVSVDTAVGMDSATQVLDTDVIDEKTEVADSEDIGETQIVDVSSADDTICIDVPADELKKKKRSVHSNFWLVVSIVAFVLIACGAVLLIVQTVFRPNSADRGAVDTTATTTTCPTRDTQHDAWLQTFVGEWYDEYSVGKRDIETQGGYKLTITKIDKDWVFFDLHSYSGGESSKMASVTGFQEKIVDDILHFEFSNDGLGNAGEGHIQFVDNAVNMEVIICGGEEDITHSLAVNAVFMRQQLPFSTGVDIQALTNETELVTALGEPISSTEYNDKNVKTCEYNGLKALVHKDGRVLTITVDLAGVDNKEMYCFDCVDGTDTYDIVKAYYGEAEQDYEESPTNIHVLRYRLAGNSSIKFTFSCDEHLLVKMHYIL